MRRPLALVLPAVLLAAACSQSPTTATRPPSARFDGGNTLGSGNAVGSGSSGGNQSTGSSPAPQEDGGIFFGGGHITDTGPINVMADSAGATERGGNYFGSGN